MQAAGEHEHSTEMLTNQTEGEAMTTFITWTLRMLRHLHMLPQHIQSNNQFISSAECSCIVLAAQAEVNLAEKEGKLCSIKSLLGRFPTQCLCRCCFD